jgi:hypothetical protein
MITFNLTINDATIEELRAIVAAINKPPGPRIARGFLGLFTKEGKQMTSASVSVDSSLIATLSFTDDKGNAAQPASPPKWTCSNPAISTIVAAADGMTAELDSVGPNGTVTYTVVAEGDSTPGVDTVTLVSDPVTWTAGEIKSGAVVFSPKPPPGPGPASNVGKPGR